MERVIAAIFLVVVVGGSPVRGGDPAADFFEKKVRPILVKSCLPCHGGKRTESGFRVASRRALLEGGDRGAAIIPGDSRRSLLIAAVSGRDPELEMPPKHPLDRSVVADLARWVDQGAVWPNDDPELTVSSPGKAHETAHWAFRRVRAVVPSADPSGWATSPIDAFIAAQQHALGIHPVEDADRRTLLRRVTFDLVGLPPSHEEIEAFLADASPLAYERVVDRLLASPAYGERWGRHWMDVARYADTAGDNADYPVPEASLYRDWIVRAWNRDMPYDEFVREQLAGDVLARRGQVAEPDQAIIATGFLALSRRYGTGSYELWHLTLEDAIETTGRAFLGLSLRCARCHDHKFDPIPSRDYYSLYGAFESTAFPYGGSEEFLTKKRPRQGFVALGDSDRGDFAAAYAVSEGKAVDAAVQRRGDPGQRGPVVARGAGRFGCLEVAPARSPAPGASGRLELAEWLTRLDHPLTARVLVNRLWQHHFGRGLVATPSNFGRTGAPPTHPALLDWLAGQLVRSGWSIKTVQRAIVTSRTYRLASRLDPAASAADPENRRYWRFTPIRLDAEPIRDAMLAAAGRLDRRMEVRQPFPPIKEWKYTQHQPFRAEYESRLRSVYLLTRRLAKDSFLGLFDGPDANTSTEERTTAITPSQALYFLNHPFVREQARAFADRLIAAEADPEGRLDAALESVWGRLADPGERERLLGFVAASVRGAAGSAAEREAWAGLAAVLFASCEFLYVD